MLSIRGKTFWKTINVTWCGIKRRKHVIILSSVSALDRKHVRGYKIISSIFVPHLCTSSVNIFRSKHFIIDSSQWNYLKCICPPGSRGEGGGGRLNIKILSYQYKDSHVKDKTVSSTVLSLTRESPYQGKTIFVLRQGPGVNKSAFFQAL